MNEAISILESGTILTPTGYTGGAVFAGLKTYGADKLDLGLIFSELPAKAVGTFTTNRVRSPSVALSESNIASGEARAIVANSGSANCCVGVQGMADAQEMTSLVAEKLNLSPSEVLICSTGIIGVELPMGLIRSGLGNLALSRDQGYAFARSIMTTDTFVKQIAVSVNLPETVIRIGGCAKGSGMIHPNMATLLGFLTTDALVDEALLNDSLRDAVDSTFNMISVDADTSTNDSVLLLANGASGGPIIRPMTPEADAFVTALRFVCAELAKSVARDGEAATKLIEVNVDGASSVTDARNAARSVSSSNLVKIAVHGNDPNWGRIMMAVGKSGADFQESEVALYINDFCVMEKGLPIPYFKESLVASMQSRDVSIFVHLNNGACSATAWGCDMTEGYVTFNSAYTT